ncbi:carbohydrate-binding module family 13 protein [Panaeolus papilionaceus]|nr:carbohydrate-binding module family 13 protein [Panaeolus papilionaceus]
MTGKVIQTLSAVVLVAVVGVNAYGTPRFQGELQLQPALNNAQCLTATANSDGAAVSIQACSNSASQKWVFNGNTIRVFGNKCLDVPEGSTTDGTKLQIWSCSAEGNANQKWDYNFWENRITWVGKGKCLDMTKGITTNGQLPQIWSCRQNNINQVWDVGYHINGLPTKSQEGQTGINNCGGGSSQNSQCQTAWVNSASDFCLFGPPRLAPVGDTEREAVAYCTKSGRGTRTMPNGTLQGVHFVKTPEYVQVTGVGNFTKINVPKGDSGGEMDNRGADGKGNPIGGLLYGNSFGSGLQFHEWTTFLSDGEFCVRACVGARAKQLCNHIYDVMGCYWNIPANYNRNQYEECDGNAATPMGVYGTSTWYQGVSPTPGPHSAPASSNCKNIPSPTAGAIQARSEMKKKREPVAFPGATPSPVVRMAEAGEL